MILPAWYLECAEDYLSILRSSREYGHSELLEATRRQRIAEYKLMHEVMNEVVEEVTSPITHDSEDRIELKPYHPNVMYQGGALSYDQRLTAKRRCRY